MLRGRTLAQVTDRPRVEPRCELCESREVPPFALPWFDADDDAQVLWGWLCRPCLPKLHDQHDHAEPEDVNVDQLMLPLEDTPAREGKAI